MLQVPSFYLVSARYTEIMLLPDTCCCQTLVVARYNEILLLPDTLRSCCKIFYQILLQDFISDLAALEWYYHIFRELGRLMQAVVLSQFCQEPNYAQVSCHDVTITCSLIVTITRHLSSWKTAQKMEPTACMVASGTWPSLSLL